MRTIILAAGQGSRMQSDLPKVLHMVGGAPLLHHCMRVGGPAPVVVVGYGSEDVSASATAYDGDAVIVHQTELLGTAHAVAQARPAMGRAPGDALVLYADTPFVRPETIARMAEARAAADVVVLGFEAAEPGGYGRLIVEDGRLARIVEAKDASPAELAVTFCNSGVVMASSRTLFDLVAAVDNDNAKREYYLTEIVEIANARGLRCVAIACNEAETLGVNTRADLAAAEAAFQARARAEALESGVTMVAPDTVWFAWDTVLGRDVTIEPNVVFGPGVTVETGARIRAFCHLEDCHLGAGVSVGPFARLRGGAELDEGAAIGNFVELKNTRMAAGAKAAHLTYLGDAEVGAKANIGAGTITCNYDGVSKHRTEIGARAFVGSNTALVAPVHIGTEAVVAAGSTVTEDVEPQALAFGRARQVTRPGLGARLMARLRAAKRT